MTHLEGAESAAECYRRAVLAATPRLLSQLDREPLSRSAGSFDREHWAWKFRDFPITMLQTAVMPLATLWRAPWPGNPYHGNTRLADWISLAVDETLRRQHRSGAFDAVGPNTRDHGVTLAVTFALAETVGLLSDALPMATTRRVEDAVRRGCAFAQRSREDYAFINNHHALFALGYLAAHRLLGESAYLELAENTVSEIVRRQSADGWYEEYGGPDPGYETLGISYLARYWRATRSTAVLESLEKSVAFLAYCVHPDGSLGGSYGSRHTSLYYPAGLELLTPEVPMAASVARFLRARIPAGNVVTPANCDTENLPSLLLSYAEAALAAAETERREPIADPPRLPCESLEGVRGFDASAIYVAGTQHYYAVANASKGGVLRVFGKAESALTYEDTGYVADMDGRRWTSQLLGLGVATWAPQSGDVRIRTTFAEVRQELLTPGKFLILRLLNLTVFRSLALGALVRRMIIARLVTSRTLGPLTLARSIHFGPDTVSVRDRLQLTRAARVSGVRLARSFTAIHMGSAKYFHGQDLLETTSATNERLATDLERSGSADNELTIRFEHAAAHAAPGALAGAGRSPHGVGGTLEPGAQ